MSNSKHWALIPQKRTNTLTTHTVQTRQNRRTNRKYSHSTHPFPRILRGGGPEAVAAGPPAAPPAPRRTATVRHIHLDARQNTQHVSLSLEAGVPPSCLAPARHNDCAFKCIVLCLFFFFTEASVGFTIESSVFFVSEQFSLSLRHRGFKFSLAQFFTIFSAQYFQVLLKTTGSIRLWVRRWCPREKGSEIECLL